jgi:hypothetical protein
MCGGECYYLIILTQLSTAQGVVLSNIYKGGRFVSTVRVRERAGRLSEERSSENQHLSTSSQMKDGEELGLLEENLNYQGQHWMIYYYININHSARTLPQNNPRFGGYCSCQPVS